MDNISSHDDSNINHDLVIMNESSNVNHDPVIMNKSSNINYDPVIMNESRCAQVIKKIEDFLNHRRVIFAAKY